MKKKHNLTILLAVLLVFFSYSLPSHAQVTIGSCKSPISGALLQIKENESPDGSANAKSGLAMPRVKLTSKTDLYPMFETTAGSGIANSAYNDPTKKANEDAKHTGLWVYNTNYCLKNAQGIAMGKGLLVWDGSAWQSIHGLDMEYAKLPIETAANSARSDWKIAWGTKVILHQPKSGVYEQFTSAYFGAAGRWMTTNLSAKAYDIGATHSQSRTLQIMPNGYTSNLYNVAYWAYPNTDGLGKPQQSTEYDKNKSVGLLYTWDAATAGKGGEDGLKNIYNPAGTNAANQEAGLPEGTGAGQQRRIQGICPAGWHLPSDYEWTVLEQEMIKQTTAYAHVSQNIHDQYPAELAKVPQNMAGASNWRGLYHGSATKEVCETSPSYDPAGTSKPASQGGFSAPLAGYSRVGSSISFGDYAFFWSSSSSGSYAAWSRGLHSMLGSVLVYSDYRYYFFSVRCKKD